MRTATSSFGPFDVSTLREILEHMSDYNAGEMIYVNDGSEIEPSTPAAVTSEWIGGSTLERELGFRYFADVDEAREVVENFGRCRTDRQFREVLELIEQWCM